VTTQLAILEVLELADGHLLPERVLVADTERLLGRRVGATEIVAEAGKLEGRGQILSVNNEDMGKRYKITDEGRARLRGA
jgi:hypothetical protein